MGTYSRKCLECGHDKFIIVFQKELGMSEKSGSRYAHLKPVAYRECLKCGQKEVIDK